jgi:hypothetical protein
MLGKLLFAPLAVSVCILAASGCGSSSKVGTASCSSCQATLSASICADLGATSGCKSSALVAAANGSCNGCSFSDCDSPPSCDGTPSPSPTGSGTPDSGAVDPKCAASDPDRNGLFTGTPPCASPHVVQINGATSYTCPCGSCPCGYQCGSIPLSVGGVIGSVCAPP